MLIKTCYLVRASLRALASLACAAALACGDGGGESTADTDATTDATDATTGTTAGSDGSGSDASSDATTDATTDVTTDVTTTTDPTTTTTDPTTGTTGDGTDAQLCVDTINMYRATLGLPPYTRWEDGEACADGQCQSDAQTNTPHGAFGQCGEFAQNECPGWSGDESDIPQVIANCLAQMWAEGPGDDFNTHGHYINMSSESYTEAACGFYVAGGEIWAIQNFR
ncbi:MAG: hypothetical protein KC636_29150 [Myxococcales bacterium]|nr:hypothetical protein [Myxococcales bacterium]